MCGYILAVPFIMYHLAGFGLNRVMGKAACAAVMLLSSATFLLHFIEFDFFRQFNNRLNAHIFDYFDSPLIILGMIFARFSAWIYLFIFFSLIFAFYKVDLSARRVIKNIFLSGSERNGCLVRRSIFFIIGALLIFLTIRGRISYKSPMRPGMAYFSKYNFANQLAQNPVYSAMNDVIYSRDSRNLLKEISMFPDSTALNIAASLLGRVHGTGPILPLRQDIKFEEPPLKLNVVLLVIESFTAANIGVLINKDSLSPFFDEIASHGTLFTGFYSNSLHTHSALFSIICGMPAIPGVNHLKERLDKKNLPGIAKDLSRSGYRTAFFVPHDSHFDNMNGFMHQNGFAEVYDNRDYNASQLSTMGVADHVMLDFAFENLKNRQNTPVFHMILTSNNHGPWIVPKDVPVDYFPGEIENAERKNAFKYTDWAVGRFMKAAEDNGFYDNTIFIIT
ncbi:MAG: LTA synthase family protein, partial [bacterium]